MKDKIKVLWIGDGGVATGFSNVNHAIIDNLPPDDYEISHLAVNYRGDWIETVPWHRLYPAMLGGDFLGLGRLQGMLEKIKPDLIFILNDLWVIQRFLSGITQPTPIVCYFPVDAGPIQQPWIEHFSKVAAIVAYTEYGKSQVQKASPQWNINVIPHGIDTTLFFPIDMIETRVEHMRGTIRVNDWIVFNGNRNQPRKRIDLTIKGFCEFAKDKPDTVRLYLHMGLEDAGFRIDTMMDRYGQSQRLYITSPTLRPDNCVSVEVLNYIYNSCDIGLNTSLGEGWGLVPFEMAACGKPQIVPDNSASREVFADGRGLIMPVREETITAPKILTEGSAPSVTAIADALQHAYDNPQDMEERAAKMLEWMLRPELQWKNIAMQWDKLFKSLLDTPEDDESYSVTGI